MNAAARDAIAMLRIHKMDGENPNFRKLKPSLPEVIKRIPTADAGADRAFRRPRARGPGALSKDEFTNTPWKTQVVQFLDLMGEAPMPDMVAWMLQVVQWTNGRAQEYVARIEKEWIGVKPDLDAIHNSFLRDVTDHFRADALNVAPVLAHLDPMPQAVVDALIRRIDDSKEPLIAIAIIKMPCGEQGSAHRNRGSARAESSGQGGAGRHSGCRHLCGCETPTQRSFPACQPRRRG